MWGHTKCQNIPNDHYQHVCWVHILTFWVENLSLIVIKLFWCISYCFFNLYGTQKHQNSCFSVSCVSIKIYQMITTSMYVKWRFWFFIRQWFFDRYKMILLYFLLVFQCLWHTEISQQQFQCACVGIQCVKIYQMITTSMCVGCIFWLF